MDNYKFRVWFKDLQVMCDLLAFEYGDGQVLAQKREQPKTIISSSRDNVEILQFTSLHDRGGVEIFDGDILLVDEGTDEETVCEVAWLNDGFVLIGNGYHGEPLYAQVRDGSFAKVIGNAYENPDLLPALNLNI